MTTEYGQRLRRAMAHAGLSQAALVRKTGAGQSTVSSAMSRGHGSVETPVYAKACGVNAHWLATGEGDMLSGNQPEMLSAPHIKAASAAPEFSPPVMTLAAWLEDLSDPEEKKRAIQACLNIAITASRSTPNRPTGGT